MGWVQLCVGLAFKKVTRVLQLGEHNNGDILELKREKQVERISRMNRQTVVGAEPSSTVWIGTVLVSDVAA